MIAKPASLLLVDDDDIIRNLLARYLERNGFVVQGVSDGKEALACIERGGHELVLLDVLMEGMGGLELLSAVRQHHSATDLPIIMATSLDRSQDVVEALDLGANDYVTKPFDFPVVLARVQTQVALKRSVDQIRQLEQGLVQQNAALEAANRRMKRDLDTGARVQAALLPGQALVLPPACFAWQFQPCTELAGDLLNVLPLPDRRVALYLLDVAGHGVAAALIAVMVNQVLTQQHLSPGRLAAPAEVAAHLSREFSWIADTCPFFTLLYGVLELDSGAFHFVSAGHPGPVFLPRDATAQNLKLPSYPIGLGDEPYEEHFLHLRPGDRLFLYSDGIPDARGKDDKRFGEGRLLAQIEQCRTAPLADGTSLLLAQLQGWCGDKPPDDDISVLAVELA
jgi:sigma-B regulation protein RsbU (phosphoserine phosphatase)